MTSTDEASHPATGELAPVRRSFVSPLLFSLFLFVLFLLEFLLFDQVGAHRVTRIYPRWNDQIQYLSEAYTGYEYARLHGFLAGLWHTLVNPSAQGTLHDFAAVILFQFTGASRSAALALNMLALIAWQVALFIAVVRRSGSRALALAAAMLPLALRGPWLIVPGSAYDFRLDHFALCAIGVTSAMAMLSRGFRSRLWSVAFGLATGITLLTRFLTGTYFVVIFVALAAWILIGAESRRRISHLTVAGVIAAVLAGPIFWLNREWVWNYYYIGHYVGPESAIRNQNFGLWKSTQFVWGWLFERHVGVFMPILAGAVALGLLVIRLTTARTQPDSAPPPPDTAADGPRDLVPLGAAFLLAPAVILTLHPQKSDVVLSALVPGLVLLILAVWLGVVRRGRSGRAAAKPMGWLAAAATIAALVYFGRCQFSQGEDPAVVANLRQVNGLADYIFAQSEAAKLQRPKVAVDYITDAFDGQVLRVVCYERHHVWIDFDMRLPTGITAPDTALVKRRVAQSDFVFLIADDQLFGGFPYDRKLLELRPQLRAWCNAHMRAVRHFTFWGHPMTLYERRGLN